MIEIKLTIKDLPGGGACSVEQATRSEEPSPEEIKAYRFFDSGLRIQMKVLLTLVGRGDLLEGHFSDELAAAAIAHWRQRIAKERGGK